eukprot:sb/3476079/
MLGSVPDMLHVHKGASQKVKDYTNREGEKDSEEEQNISLRYSTISAAVMAEVTHFHTQRNKDFNIMMREFLTSQLEFHSKRLEIKLFLTLSDLHKTSSGPCSISRIGVTHFPKSVSPFEG